ncbi:ankyrin repeat domain-containing protein [Nonomuraea sp. CA-218870]|uniref:ankyrin repeat domain-containing protein n=1 Tax=Nonomuraea sp. CA-218870 TaxID=3239998 RepID=UPI003D8F2920
MHEEQLYRAALDGDEKTVGELLAAGADPDRPYEGEEGGLPLCAAAARDRAAVAGLLLAAGAGVDTREGGGWTALMWAATNGAAGTARVLIEAGADVDAANETGDTPLTLAARRGALGVVRELLDAGADPARYDGDGDTAHDIAADWVGVHLEGALLDQVEQEDWTYAVHRQWAGDGTELVTVTATSPDGSETEQVEAQRGHAAIATLLEAATGEWAPIERLVARALAHRDLDEDAETWWAAADALAARGDDKTYVTLTELCASEDAREREFGVDAIAQFGVTGEDRPYLERTLPLLRRMTVTESSPQVLRSVLAALGHQGDPRALPLVLGLIGRPGHQRTMTDAIALADALADGPAPGHDEGLALLIEMTGDDDGEVRDWATAGLAGLDADTPEIRDALAARLDDHVLRAVAEAARGLARRGDPRAGHGARRVRAESDDPELLELVGDVQDA